MGSRYRRSTPAYRPKPRRLEPFSRPLQRPVGMPEHLKIVLGDAGSLARYPQGGGHWAVFAQYLAGLLELGHDVLLLEVASRSGPADEPTIDAFFANVNSLGWRDRVALLTYAESDWPPDLDQCTVRG